MYNFTNEGFPYRIRPSDTYELLAKRFQITLENLYAVNPGVNPYHLYVGQPIFIPSLKRSRNNNRQTDCVTKREVELMRNERSLWEEHVAWTRMAIISLTFKLPDVNFVIARLLKNATDMGEMIRPIYGETAANT